MGFRPIDVGPVTMGFRLSTEKTGFNIYQNLVYPKGAYILHMIRMMMWSSDDGDQSFMDTMHDFVASHRLQAATTEDFKATVEKHMDRQMDLDGNHRMDWFFNQYVYGMDLPTYHFESQLTKDGDATTVHFKLTQSGVPASFKMIVPVYLELTDGRTTHLGMLTIVGDSTYEKTMQLPKYPSPIKRVMINYNYDVLAIEN
jgi:aminopeptidase N